MSSHTWQIRMARFRYTPFLLCISILTILLTACGGSASTPTNGAPTLAAKQVLTFPNVGTTDIGFFDPATGPDAKLRPCH